MTAHTATSPSEFWPDHPIAPMLAKVATTIPAPDSVPGGLLYEPKWDGFRAIIRWDGAALTISSRSLKPLTRYFPELSAELPPLLPVPCILDGEIVVRKGAVGREHLDWEALSQRIHPSERRIAELAAATPADFVAFDLLAFDDRPLLDEPFATRRQALEQLLSGARTPLHLSQTTRDSAVARRWLTEFEGAGLDGVIAKPLSAPYSPGKRIMVKIKHARTADVVVVGYRLHTSGRGLGSLLLGLWNGDELKNIGGVSAFSDKRRLELLAELAPFVLKDLEGTVADAATERNRFSGGKDTSFVPLQPTLVVEVGYDQLEGLRFRHTAQFVRWRPDREARSCTFDQLVRPISYDLGAVLA